MTDGIWTTFDIDFGTMTAMVTELETFLSNKVVESAALQKYDAWVKESEIESN